MARSVETAGKTIEHALQKALKSLSANPEDVDIEILEEAQGGLFGFFSSKNVKIRVSMRSAGGLDRGSLPRRGSEHSGGANGAAVELLEDIVRKVLMYLGIDYDATVEEMPDTTFININSDGLDGLLIGRRGETLASIQHVVNRIYTAKTGEHSKITIDVGGYIKRKHRLLVEKAHKVADRVRKTNKDYDFEPLKAADRRIIHLAVADFSDVSTYTIGDGLLRKVVITLKSDGSDR